MPPTPMIIGFAVLVIGFLILDLGVLNRRAHVIKFRESLMWSGFWVVLALAFAGGVHFYLGAEKSITFLTGYVVELSLSVDNLFVFLLIFTAFRIPAELQHRVLFWGIVGALGMRAVCIGAGVAALQRFHWLLYIFGAMLIYGGIKTLLKKEDDGDDPSQGAVARFIRKIMPVTPDLHGNHFFVRMNGKRHATPLFLALVIIEISDLVFAVDSIPAVLAISQDPFIVYTSNVFAILGLRSIYFALAHLLQIFRYLKYAISLILIFVGAKIALANVFKVPVGIALGVIVLLLAAAVVLSVLIKPGPGGAGDAAEGKGVPPA
jgi:tellurite resistance protein TerC